MDTSGTVAAGGMLSADVHLEWYRYDPGPPVVLPRHSHEEYQVNVAFGQPSGITYRGGYHTVPPRQLTVVMPDEPHLPRDPAWRDAVATHFTLYVRPALLERVAGAEGTPTFRDLLIADERTVMDFARMHAAVRDASTTLAREVPLLSWCAELVERHASGRRSTRTPPAHAAVRRAKDYLHDHHASNVSLTELAAVSGLSPFRLNRLFSSTVGVPPHSYQLQLRVDRAKRLLLRGRSVSDTAHDVGFFDLSHFSRHFKRYVGVSPGRYGKNVHS